MGLESIDNDKFILEAWKRECAYNQGALFICEADGCVIKTTSKVLDIPAGAIGTIDSGCSRQFCAHASCVSYTAVVFHCEGLCQALGRAMEETTGYTPALHESLKACQEFLERGGDSAEPMMTLQNQLVSTRSRNPKAEARAREAAEEEKEAAAPSASSWRPARGGDASAAPPQQKQLQPLQPPPALLQPMQPQQCWGYPLSSIPWSGR